MTELFTHYITILVNVYQEILKKIYIKKLLVTLLTKQSNTEIQFPGDCKI